MIAILSTDPILTRMLTLEAERGQISLVSPEEATLWLLDLDHPPRPLPKKQERYVIGFTREQSISARADLILPLPYPTATLQELLARYARKAKYASDLRYLPGIALINDKKIRLSPAEERIFSLLFAKAGEVVTEQELLTALADSHAGSNVLQVHIYRLRRKLSNEGVSRIRAVRGVGYRLV